VECRHLQETNLRRIPANKEYPIPDKIQGKDELDVFFIQMKLGINSLIKYEKELRLCELTLLAKYSNQQPLLEQTIVLGAKTQNPPNRSSLDQHSLNQSPE
jgi:hypothetical protein